MRRGKGASQGKSGAGVEMDRVGDVVAEDGHGYKEDVQDFRSEVARRTPMMET